MFYEYCRHNDESGECDRFITVSLFHAHGRKIKVMLIMVNSILNVKENILSPGEVSNEQFFLLIDISPVRSDKVIHALQAYFVNGEKRNVICEKYHINPGYLSIKIREIQSLSRRILDMYPYFFRQIPHVS